MTSYTHERSSICVDTRQIQINFPIIGGKYPKIYTSAYFLCPGDQYDPLDKPSKALK